MTNDARPGIPVDVLDDMDAAFESLRYVRVPKQGRISFRRFSDIRLGPISPYIVKNLIGAGDIAVIYAEPKAAKSFLALHIAHRVSVGAPVFGQRVKQCPVAFFALEGEGGLDVRIEAYRQRYGDTSDVYIHARPLPLFDNADLEGELIAAVKAVGAKLIVVDTLAKAMVGGNENLAEDMGKMIAVFERVRDATGAAILIVHHAGKDRAKGARGSNALLGAVDLEAEVVKHEDGTRALVITNARNVLSGIAYPFDLEVVDLEPDEDGDARSSCAVVELDGPVKIAPKAATSLSLTKRERRVLGWIEEARDTCGQPPPPSLPPDLPRDLRVVTRDAVRAIGRIRVFETGKDYKDPMDTVRKAVAEALPGLTTAHLVQTHGEFIWIVPRKLAG